MTAMLFVWQKPEKTESEWGESKKMTVVHIFEYVLHSEHWLLTGIIHHLLKSLQGFYPISFYIFSFAHERFAAFFPIYLPLSIFSLMISSCSYWNSNDRKSPNERCHLVASKRVYAAQFKTDLPKCTKNNQLTRSMEWGSRHFHVFIISHRSQCLCRT